MEIRRMISGSRFVQARLFVVVLVTLGLLGIAGIPTSNVRAASAPTLSIVSPSNGAVLGNGSPVVIVFAVTNFTLADPGNGSSSPNAGHVDVFVDSIPVTKASVNTVVLSLPSGPHAIRLSLVADNGSALDPDVTTSVSVLVTEGPAEGTPTISILFPHEGALLGTDVPVSYRVTNFVLIAPGRPVSALNEGHVHALLDAKFLAEVSDYAPFHLVLKDGPHQVTFQLVDNEHQPLSPGVETTVNFTVRALAGRVVQFDATLYFAAANLILGMAILAAIYRRLEVP
jgi:hypothetical protein